MKVWVLRIFRHGASQAVAQAAAFATGILIVRALSKTEYAQYSLATMLIPAVSIVADSGVSGVLLSLGQRARDSPSTIAQLYRAALRQRTLIGIPTMAVGGIWLGYLLFASGASYLDVLGIVLLVIVTFSSTLTVGILQGVHRIQIDVHVLRNAILIPALARLVLTTGLFVSNLLSIWTLLVASAMVSIGTQFYLWKKAQIARASDATQWHSEFARGVRRVLPMTVAMVITSQAYLGVITLKGSPQVLAEFSALSRFGLAFSLFAPIVSDIVAPLIARAPSSRTALLRATGIAYASLLSLILIATGVTWSCRAFLLSLLGPQYRGLSAGLVLVFAGYGVAFMGHSMNSITQGRGWFSGSWTYLVFGAGWGLLAVLYPSVSDVYAAAILFIAQCAVFPLSQLLCTIVGLKRTPRDLSPNMRSLDLPDR